MKMRKLHNWNLSYAQARQLQIELAGRVQFTPVKKKPRVVAGLDCAFSKDGKRIFAVVVVLRLPGFEVIETTEAIGKVTFPYIPGLLSFREAPVCLAAVEKLQKRPDAFIIDGQGVAHPRRLGLAAHLGLFFDAPTIGCAKSRLIGEYEEPPLQKGSYSWLTDSSGRKSDLTMPTAECRLKIANRKSQIVNPIGAVVRTRSNVKPVFVSVGNKCTLANAIEITLACTTKYRLPEPTRLAHQQVSKLKLKA
jgi:deoxyribonuclease V